MTKKEKIVLSILCIIIAFMVLSGLPAVLLKITFADVDPFIIPLGQSKMDYCCNCGFVSYNLHVLWRANCRSNWAI